MQRRSFLKTVAASALGATGCAVLPTCCDKTTPNVLLIFIDDLGYADVGYHNCPDIPTPHIDSIAQNGVELTSGYVSAPVCAPSRAGLLTGRYQERFGFYMNQPPAPHPQQTDGLPTSELTIGTLMKQAGYATGAIGKWHMGFRPELHPLQRGFDEFYGFLGGAHDYYQSSTSVENCIRRNDTPVDEPDYLTNAFTREACDFIKRHRDERFFLYLAYNAPHIPMQAPEEYLQRFKHIDDPKRRTYAAMVTVLDEGIGNLLATLKANGCYDNTLIFFINDNGGPPRSNASSNEPLHGSKGWVLEGGIRVPFLIQWPAVLPQGTQYHKPVISLDVLPTSVAVAHGALPTDRIYDGVNLIQYLTGQKTGPPHEYLYWRIGHTRAIRWGNWKLAQGEPDPPLLFDLSTDLEEKHDLVKQYPDIVTHLDETLKAWEAQLAPPLWEYNLKVNPSK